MVYMGQYFQVLAGIKTLKVFKKHINNSTKICEKQKLVMNHHKYQRNRQQLKTTFSHYVYTVGSCHLDNPHQ